MAFKEVARRMFVSIKNINKNKQEVIINTELIASLVPDTNCVVMCGRIAPFIVDKRTFNKLMGICLDKEQKPRKGHK